MFQYFIFQENKFYIFGFYVELFDEMEDILVEFNYNFKRVKFFLFILYWQLKGLLELGG